MDKRERCYYTAVPLNLFSTTTHLPRTTHQTAHYIFGTYCIPYIKFTYDVICRQKKIVPSVLYRFRTVHECQNLYSATTIPIQCNNNTYTVQQQYLYCATTIPIQCNNNTYTVQQQYLYSAITIPIQCNNNTYTVQ